MKKLFLLIIVCALSLSSSCDNDDINNSKTETWFLVNISGGFAGINNDIEKGTVIWTFNRQDSILKIENYNDDVIAFGSGTYSCSILNSNNKNYLSIEGNEFGGMITSGSELIIDQNMQSEGSGADKFRFRFVK
jgi:ABC-type oligopeptide transport system substrate-binding subunit